MTVIQKGKYKIELVRKGTSPDEFYCGRPTALGNPYPMNSEKDRDRVCNAYDQSFEVRRATSYKMRNELALIWRHLIEHKTVQLSCYCSPKRCHTETIANYLFDELEKLGNI